MKFRHLAFAAAASAMVAGTASAAGFSLIPVAPSGTPSSIAGNIQAFGSLTDSIGTSISLDNALFKDDNGVKQVFTTGGGTPVSTFDNSNAATGGLFLQGSGTLTFTFLGSEASFLNSVNEVDVAFGGNRIRNQTGVFGDSFSTFVDQANATSLVDFSFDTRGGSSGEAVNGGPIDVPLLLAFTNVFNNGRSVIAFFEDKGGNDLDLDDMVVRIDVVPVPVPASIMLLFSAFAGAGFLARKRASVA